MKYSKQQIYTIAAAALFLVGAIFMLVNTFADESWAFWVGLSFAIIAAAVYVMLVIENRKLITKKLNDTTGAAPATIEATPTVVTETTPTETKTTKTKSKK